MMAMPETVRQRVRAHDQYQIEFKLDYDLLPTSKTRYQITTYLFVPQSLGIRQGVYPESEFYRDIQNYVRLKTPVLPLRDIACAPTSPLRRIERLLLDPNTLLEAGGESRLINSFKFLRAVLKTSLRRHLRRIKAACTGQRGAEGWPGNVAALASEFIAHTQEILAQYRGIGRRLEQPNVDAQMHQAYRLTDESISLVVEESLVHLFRLVHRYLPGDVQCELKPRIEQAVQNEGAYRKHARYGAQMQPSGDNEAFLFRSSVLKKFTSSVLYLSLVVKREGASLEHILSAVAAGLSMVFATLVAFYFQDRYGELTFPFFVALVVGYMFKDRIKELGRIFFARHLRNWLYDRRILIKTLDGAHTLGFMREKVTFVAEDEAPPAITAQRNRNLITALDNEGQGEHVLCYTKEVVLRSQAFQQIYTGGPEITGITDIMRLDMRPYLRKMDDPLARWFHIQDGEVQTAQAAKVYYLNFVTAYTAGDRQPAEIIERTQVTLTRDGIRRVEHLG
jgi:hypothetical protein